MFERFSAAAREVVVVSQEEARHLRHGQIGSEHLLLALCAYEIDSGLQTVFNRHGLTIGKLRVQVAAAVAETVNPPCEIPFTPTAKRALLNGVDEAIALGHMEVSPLHLLAGLLREPDCVGVRVLWDLNVPRESLLHEVQQLLPPEPEKEIESDELTAARRYLLAPLVQFYTDQGYDCRLTETGMTISADGHVIELGPTVSVSHA
jgi:ATP-dependent Clp protease ATP-binding subunit ClpA